VLAGIGAAPNDGLARRAGLAVDDGILVDSLLATSDPSVFAAGDCARFPHPDGSGATLRLESWRNAVDQADVAARNMLGLAEPYVAVPWFWSDQYDLGLQITGLPGPGRTEVARRYGDRTVWFELDPGGVLVRASGLGPGTSVAKDIRVAQLLIATHRGVDPQSLQDPDVPLKSLLRRSSLTL
jgi:3-phenylpropionate/trans-cinnamate dioxygenase ferredoxin reductase subunit